MRRLLILVLLAIASPASAQEAEPAAATEVKPGHGKYIPEPKAADVKPRGRVGPSGYWTGYRPARGGAYRWRLMGIGAVVLAITIVLLVRTLRRAGRRTTS